MAWGGYCGRVLRVNLTRRTLDIEPLEEKAAELFSGGAGLGAYYLWQEVGPGVTALSPDNKMFLFTGPLTGTKAPGSGGCCGVAVSASTELAGSTQANGYLGAFLKTQGLDGVIFEGAAETPVYLLIRDGRPELKDATLLWGRTTQETEDGLKQEHGLPGLKSSVYAIGPAGENLVRFAVLIGDGGHVFGHNGLGAVLGSKKVKALVVARGAGRFPLADEEKLNEVAARMRAKAVDYMNGDFKKYGTAGLVLPAVKQGILPVRNLTTNIFPEAEKLDGRYLRSTFPNKPKTCFQCPIAHNRIMTVTEGPYQGLQVKEPEYELLAALGSNLGIIDPGAVMYLGDLVNQLGLNGTETGWTVSWLINGQEAGILSEADLDGLKLGWGRPEGVERLIRLIADREGLGDLLAEGVSRAAQKMGGPARDLAVYTEKGASPRGHDHRARWMELFDTCVSNTGTIEATFGPRYPDKLAPPLENAFDHLAVARTNGRINGWRQFEDTLGLCRFCTNNAPEETVEAFAAATGQPADLRLAQTIGRRIVNLLRVFNLDHGLDVRREKPSARYGSTPADGPAQGRDIMSRWEEMRRAYYDGMGWDQETGRPRPETLATLGLLSLIEKKGG
ncbi:MAG: aldehyde ferredoxin oxidoreductase C-terminal domain-containing protein [Thermodesulfobacteriota bacterium]